MNPAGIDGLIQQLRAAAGGTVDPPSPPLNPPGGGGTSGGMEPRLARLEAHMEHVLGSLDRLREVPTKLAVLEERVSHLPTKSWMVATAATALALIAGLITFSEKLHALVG